MDCGFTPSFTSTPSNVSSQPLIKGINPQTLDLGQNQPKKILSAKRERSSDIFDPSNKKGSTGKMMVETNGNLPRISKPSNECSGSSLNGEK